MHSVLPDNAPNRADALLFDEPTPLESLIARLQGDASGVQLDAGVAQFDREALDRIAGCAAHEREVCDERINCLLELLDAAACGDRANLPHALVATTVRHVLRMLRDARRWSVLAENATYYRNHPEIAARIADFVAGHDPAGSTSPPQGEPPDVERWAETCTKEA